MTRELSEVISDIFTYHGAVVENTRGGYMEFLAPQDFCEALGIPEEGLLNFSYHDSSEEMILAGYDSELFQSMEKLFVRNGRLATCTYPLFEPNFSKLSRKITEEVAFSNAIFRVERTQRRTISYLLIFFRFTALSDVKQEGVISLMMNELNRSCIPIYHVSDIFSQLSDRQLRQERTTRVSAKLLRSACSSASLMVREELLDFIRSLERRLNRDIRRVYDYYETLREETRKAIQKKKGSLQEPQTNKDRTQNIMNRLLKKLDAIETERKWKIQDLISKYALKIEVEPIAVIKLETVSDVFWLEIKRRLSTRKILLAYNSIVKQLDSLPCESCFYPRPGYYVCDEKLHILCTRCFGKCPYCGKQFCSACHKSKCPKCRKRRDTALSRRDS